MLGIRTKLSLGLLGLLAIIMIVGIQSVMLLDQLGGSIELILRENYRSIIACYDIKDSLEGVERGALYFFSGYKEDGLALIQENLSNFDKALQVEQNNITLPGEKEKVIQLDSLFSEYKTLIDEVTHVNSSDHSMSQIYLAKGPDLVKSIRITADEILQMNQLNMNRTSNEARDKATESRRTMIMLIGIGGLLTVGFMILIGKWILRPIAAMTRAAQDIKQGNLEVVIHKQSKDEIGELSQVLDEMTARIREFRRSDRDNLLRIRQSTELAFNALPDAIAVLNNEGVIELVNTVASNLFGLKQGQSLSDLPFHGLDEICREALRVSEMGAQSKDEAPLIQRFIDGEEKFYRPRATAVLDSRNIPTGLILVLSDVTQQHFQNELKKGLVAIVAHQLRTPLTSIRMALHLLLEEKIGPLTDKQLDLTFAAREDSDRLHLILEKLLMMGRIEFGKANLDKPVISSHELVFNSVEPFQRKALDLGITLNVQLMDDLPSVYADSVLISQVFANLLSNSLKYTTPGGSITISAEYDESFVNFHISDTGKGIPEQYLQKIMQQFFRVPGQSGVTGIGLGLSIVQEIVSAHGGTISVESVEGSGSKFSFSLVRSKEYPGLGVKPWTI